jgi:hypothetical protein
MTRYLDMVGRYCYGQAGYGIGKSPGTAALMALGAAVRAAWRTERERIEG